MQSHAEREYCSGLPTVEEVCRYAYNMVLMQHFKFTPGSIEDFNTTSPAFNVGIKDITRMRKELSALILNMSPLYVYVSSSNEDVASTSSD